MMLKAITKHKHTIPYLTIPELLQKHMSSAFFYIHRLGMLLTPWCAKTVQCYGDWYSNAALPGIKFSSSDTVFVYHMEEKVAEVLPLSDCK